MQGPGFEPQHCKEQMSRSFSRARDGAQEEGKEEGGRRERGGGRKGEREGGRELGVGEKRRGRKGGKEGEGRHEKEKEGEQKSLSC